MLIEFSVGNYLSFKDTVTLSMVASEVAAKNEKLNENNVFKVDDELSLLKSAAIYGANASGKSNLIKALKFMQNFVINSSRGTQITDPIDVEEFRLSTTTVGKPSFFQIVFYLEEKIYRYGFEVDKNQVISEWLFQTPKIAERKLFERKLNKFKVTKTFNEGEGLTEKTRKNALFLSVASQFNGKISNKILFWFNNIHIISGLHSNRMYRKDAVEYFKDNEYQPHIIKLIKKLDLGINDIKLETIKTIEKDFPLWRELPDEENYSLLRRLLVANEADVFKTIHKIYDENGNAVSRAIFDMDKNESEGTQKIFAFAGIILDGLKKRKILFIDELDARLHPLMTREIITLFNSNETNFNNAQLIFITHDINLLSCKFFRKEQIWFTEKNKKEATDLYSLVEFNINDEAQNSLKSDYIKGRYGAIPFIGDLVQIIGDV
ncbi:AAA family ATPase [Gloeothece verrucosa]|uniref:ATPase AAA-type core domain-containing protein n=1 Tax=Gloeothece verrucosa (strain PCC 7822) TaxID=497965 RepID=E0U6K6_GLOV7|nr:ATP-binding protein [Gloeothece verrucosa]ADN14765.1 conserved hypothetical protein [Gloeothece verrucosa PCC 7822]